MNKTQIELLEISKKVDELFNANGIKYMILYGSVLGAVRHKGFIPWDDDMDIGVFRKDLQKAEELLQTLPDYFYEPTESDVFSKAPIGKLKYPDPEKEQKDWTTYDIFVIENMPSDVKLQKKMYRAAKWVHLGSLRRPPENHGFLLKVISWCLLTFIPQLIWKRIKANALKKITKYQDQNTELLGVVLDSSIKDIFERDIFENITKVPFEDTMLPIPVNYDNYLTQMYGDYMTPPPVEYRYPDHSSKAGYLQTAKTKNN